MSISREEGLLCSINSFLTHYKTQRTLNLPCRAHSEGFTASGMKQEHSSSGAGVPYLSRLCCLWIHQIYF